MKTALTACAYFHTEITKDHDGHSVTEISLVKNERIWNEALALLR